MENVEIMMEALCRSMGDYAPRKRRLIADYKDHCGNDLNQPLTVWHHREASDKDLVESVRSELFQKGFTLCALWELQEGARISLLYLAPGYVEAALREMSRKAPENPADAALEEAAARLEDMQEKQENPKRL